MATDTLDAMRKMMALQKDILANVVSTAEDLAVAAEHMKRPIMIAGDSEDDVPFYPTNSDVAAAEYIATTLAPVLDIINTSPIVRLLAAGTLLAIVAETISPANNLNSGSDGNLVLGAWALSMGLVGVAQQPTQTHRSGRHQSAVHLPDLNHRDKSDFAADMNEFEQAVEKAGPSGDVEIHPLTETAPIETSGLHELAFPPKQKPAQTPDTLAAKIMDIPIVVPKLTGNPTPRWITPNKDK